MRAFVGWPLVSRSIDKDQAVRHLSHNMVKFGAADDTSMPEVEHPKATDAKVYDGKPARMATASAVPLEQSSCAPPKLTSVAVAFDGKIGTVVFMLVYDASVKHAVEPRTVDRIISSLRDLG